MAKTITINGQRQSIDDVFFISGYDIYPKADNVWSIGTASYSIKDLHVQNIVYATSVAGNWNPSADDTYDLGENSTPLEWKDLYIDGVAYIDTLQVEVAGVVLDDILFGFGTGGVASLLWETADADTNILLCALPAAAGNDIPLFLVADADAVNVDLDIFKLTDYLGRSANNIAVIDTDRDHYIAMGFVADDSQAIHSSRGLNIYLGRRLATGGIFELYPRDQTAKSFKLDITTDVVPSIFGQGAYLRIGDANVTALAVPTEDDLHVSGVLSLGSFQELIEVAAPGAGAANTARIYAFEGAGDALTDLCAVFQDGTVDVFAQESTEPDSPIFQFPDMTDLKLQLRKPNNKTVQFAAIFPDGREFIMRELRYPEARWN